MVSIGIDPYPYPKIIQNLMIFQHNLPDNNFPLGTNHKLPDDLKPTNKWQMFIVSLSLICRVSRRGGRCRRARRGGGHYAWDLFLALVFRAYHGLPMENPWLSEDDLKIMALKKYMCVLMNFNSLEDVFWKKNLLRRWLQGYSRRNSCTRMGGHLNSCWLFRPLKAPTMRHEQKMGVSGNSVGENDGDPLELAPFHLGFALWEPPKNLNIVDFPFGKSKIFGKSRSVTGRRGIIFIHLEPQTSLKGSLHKRMCRSYTCGPCR